MTRRLVLWLGHFDPGFPFPMLVHLGLLALLFCLAAAFVIVGGLFDIEIGPQAAMCLAIVIVLGLVADAAADANAIARACAAARSSAGDGAMKFILGKISHAARAIDDFVDPFGFLKTILLAFILLGLLYAGFDAGLATLPEYRKFDAERSRGIRAPMACRAAGGGRARGEWRGAAGAPCRKRALREYLGACRSNAASR